MPIKINGKNPGIVFWFETFDKDVFSSRPIIDLDAWRYAAKAGGITKLRCINTSGMKIDAGGDMDFEIIGESEEDFIKWVKKHKNQNLILFETPWTAPKGSIPFSKLNHKTADWYVFGSASGISPDLPGKYVYLPQDGTGALHSVHIASAVMLRRWEELTLRKGVKK
jgi:hypothetical protein